MSNRYESKSMLPENYPAVAKVYAKVFAGEPWNEVSRCCVCGKFSDKDPSSSNLCEGVGCSGAYSLEAYPLNDTAQYIGKELDKTNAIGLFLSQLEMLQRVEQVCGFGWGYQFSPEDFSKEKYRSEEMRCVVADLLVRAGFFSMFLRWA